MAVVTRYLSSSPGVSAQQSGGVIAPCADVTRVRLDLGSAGADGRTSRGWEAAELAVPNCPASAVTPAVPPAPPSPPGCWHQLGVQSFSPNVPMVSLVLE